MNKIRLMNSGNYYALKEDRTLLMMMHLSQLLFLVSGVGGIVVPLLIWILKKDEVQNMDEQGKEVLNFQISLFIYYAIFGVLSIVIIGIPFLIGTAILNIVYPIINSIKANDGVEYIRYPFNLRFIK